MESIWDIKMAKDKKDMNWAEAKWNNPRLNPNGDWDNDGFKNQFDCKPFDSSRDRELSAFLGMIQGNKEAAKGLVKAVVSKRIAKESAARRIVPRNTNYTRKSITAQGPQNIPTGYKLQIDLRTGRKVLVPLSPQEVWTR